MRLVEEDQQIAEDVAPEAVEEFEPEQPATTGGCVRCGVWGASRGGAGSW